MKYLSSLLSNLGSVALSASRFGVVACMMMLVLLTSCKKEMLFPVASGRPYEVLVVIDKDMWERPSGRSLFNVLDTDVPGLPQSERSFRISQCKPDDLDQALRIFRNVIVVDINPQMYTQTKLKFMRDKDAMEQIWVTLQSPSEEDFVKYCTENRQFIVDFLTKMEMNRLIRLLETKHSLVAQQLSLDLFDCDFWAPDEIGSSKRGRDFFWASNNSSSGMVNVCVYSYPYEGPETFNKEYVLAKRDSVMRSNIPGEKPNMYMKTDTLYTDCKPTVVHGDYAYESRGLWYMENDGMGGPFVSLSRVDTTRNLVIVAEGFVYAPEKMKRGLIRRVEACLYTLMLPAEKEKKAQADAGGEEEIKKGNS